MKIGAIFLSLASHGILAKRDTRGVPPYEFFRSPEQDNEKDQKRELTANSQFDLENLRKHAQSRSSEQANHSLREMQRTSVHSDEVSGADSVSIDADGSATEKQLTQMHKVDDSTMGGQVQQLSARKVIILASDQARDHNVQAPAPLFQLLTWTKQNVKYDALNSTILKSSLISESHRSRMQSILDWYENEFGGRMCDKSEYEQFAKDFRMTTAINLKSLAAAQKSLMDFRGNVRDAEPCPKGNNILWIYPQKISNGAFEIDQYACHRLLAFRKRACSTNFVRVSNLEEAQNILENYEDGTINHLVLGGHGDGNGMVWGRKGKEGESLKANHRDSIALLHVVGAKMSSGSTIFLDSCLSSTQSEIENLGYVVAREISKSMNRPDDASKGLQGVTVYGSVHSLSNEAVNVVAHDNGDDVPRLEVKNVKGTVEWHASVDKDPPVPFTGKPIRGTWVRTHYVMDPIAGTVSQETCVGFLTGITKKGKFEVLYSDDVTGTIEASWITSAVVPGGLVMAAANGVGQKLVQAKYVSMGSQPDEVSILLPGRSTEQTIDADLVRPYLAHVERKQIGEQFPEPGDWVHVYTDAKKQKQTFAGIAMSYTNEGAKVALGKSGRSMLTVRSLDMVAVAKPHSSVMFYFEKDGSKINTPVGGIYLGAKEGIAKVKALDGGMTRMVDPDWIVSARFDGEGGVDIFRSTVDDCPCQITSPKDWDKMGCKNEMSPFCCNPDSDEDSWCVVSSKLPTRCKVKPGTSRDDNQYKWAKCGPRAPEIPKQSKPSNSVKWISSDADSQKGPLKDLGRLGGILSMPCILAALLAQY